MNDQSLFKNTQSSTTPLHPDGTLVTAVTYWTDQLFSFRLARPRTFRFRSGEFVMIGLPGENGKPILRAYSIASPSWDDELEFYSIIVPQGPLTSRLQHIQVGDIVILRPKPVGTLVIDALLPGKRLFLFATGTGIAPFASLIRDPEVFEKFDSVILTHTCRTNAELEYGRQLVTHLKHDPLIGDFVDGKLQYYPTTTQEPSENIGRITDLIETGKIFDDLEINSIDPKQDRVMICGSRGFNLDLRTLCENVGFYEGANSKPGTYVLEKAFVGE